MGSEGDNPTVAARRGDRPVHTDMATVRHRKQDMIDREIAFHLNAYKESGAAEIRSL